MTATLAPDRRLSGGHTIQQWATDVLAGIGAPATSDNIAALVTWANHESGGYNPSASGGLNNPLNTTEGAMCNAKVPWPLPGSCRNGGSQGNIKDFSTYQLGVASIVHNLTRTRGAGYESIVAALRAGNNPQAVFQAVDASRFGTHGLAGTTPTQQGIGGGGATATLTSSSDCVWGLTMPGPIPNLCITHSQGRALLGAVSLVAGLGILAIGLAFMAANTRAASRVLSVTRLA